MINNLSLLAAICLSLSTPVVAEDVTPRAMNASQFFDVGVTLLREGQAKDAANIADVLLAQKPNSTDALILRTEAALGLGDFAGGITYGSAAYHSTKNPNQKFGAANLVALAHSRLRNDTRAQIWLRRARQFAPDAASAEQIANDYRAIRARNPWSTSLRFGIMPTSNVNNGSSSTSSQLFDLPFEFQLDAEAQALSGLQITGGVDTRYRLIQSKTSATFLTASADVQTYVLSPSSADDLQADNDARVIGCEGRPSPELIAECLSKLSPVKTGSDYSFESLTFGVHHKQILTEGSRPTDFVFRFGQTWYGGAPYSRNAEAIVGHSWALSDADQLALSLSYQNRKDLNTMSAVWTRTSGISAKWVHLRANNDRFTFGTTYRRSTSLAPDSDYKSIALEGGYDFDKPINGMRFGFGISRENRDFDASDYASGPRADKSVTLDMSINFANVEFYGFQPVVKLQARRNDSSIDLFDRDYTTVGFDLRSSF